jgi:hypothetical protein
VSKGDRLEQIMKIVQVNIYKALANKDDIDCIVINPKLEMQLRAAADAVYHDGRMLTKIMGLHILRSGDVPYNSMVFGKRVQWAYEEESNG